MSDDLTVGNLGLGWEETDRALCDLQADLSRTIPDSPTLVLLWREGGVGDEWPYVTRPSNRWGFIGTSAEWYYGADGGFELSRDYATSVVDIADRLADAIADTLLGYHAYWPHCPVDDQPIAATRDDEGKCWWVCTRHNHVVAEVGQLPATNVDTSAGRGDTQRAT